MTTEPRIKAYANFINDKLLDGNKADVVMCNIWENVKEKGYKKSECFHCKRDITISEETKNEYKDLIKKNAKHVCFFCMTQYINNEMPIEVIQMILKMITFYCRDVMQNNDIDPFKLFGLGELNESN